MTAEHFRCKIPGLDNTFLQSFIRKRRPGTWNGNNTADLRYLLQNTHCCDNRLGERQHILEELRSNLGRRQAAVWNCMWFSTAILRKSWYVHPTAGYGNSKAQPLGFTARDKRTAFIATSYVLREILLINHVSSLVLEVWLDANIISVFHKELDHGR